MDDQSPTHLLLSPVTKISSQDAALAGLLCVLSSYVNCWHDNNDNRQQLIIEELSTGLKTVSLHDNPKK